MLKTTSLFFVGLLISMKLMSATTVIQYVSEWKYLDNGSNQGTAWKSNIFNDSSWKTGSSLFGYGITGANTTISYGANATGKYITTYFRKAFTIKDFATFSSFTGKVKFDDGIVIYLNGKQVYRNGMPGDAIAFNTLAATAGDGGLNARSFVINSADFVSGTNVFTVEVHQLSKSDPDMAFALKLDANTPSSTDKTLPSVISIQRQTPNLDTVTASAVTFRVIFSEVVGGVDIADFSLSQVSTVKGRISSVTTVGSTTYDIAVTAISGQGKLRVDLKSSGTAIADTAGNLLTGGYTRG